MVRLLRSSHKGDDAQTSLREMFHAADKDKTGTLDVDELKQVIVRAGFDGPTEVFDEVLTRFQVS